MVSDDIAVDDCRAVGFGLEPGGDIANYTGITTVEACADKCKELDACVVWLYNPKTLECWSKDKYHGSPIPWWDGIIGPRNCLSRYHYKTIA